MNNGRKSAPIYSLLVLLSKLLWVNKVGFFGFLQDKTIETEVAISYAVTAVFPTLSRRQFSI